MSLIIKFLKSFEIEKNMNTLWGYMNTLWNYLFPPTDFISVFMKELNTEYKSRNVQFSTSIKEETKFTQLMTVIDEESPIVLYIKSKKVIENEKQLSLYKFLLKDGLFPNVILKIISEFAVEVSIQEIYSDENYLMDNFCLTCQKKSNCINGSFTTTTINSVKTSSICPTCDNLIVATKLTKFYKMKLLLEKTTS